MGNAAWFTYGSFEESRRFLHDLRARHDRLALFEYQLRRVLQALERAGKPLILTETGFPSAVGYHVEGERRVVPHNDPERYAVAMQEFVTLIARANRDYENLLAGTVFL